MKIDLQQLLNELNKVNPSNFNSVGVEINDFFRTGNQRIQFAVHSDGIGSFTADSFEEALLALTQAVAEKSDQIFTEED